jgi:aspartyl-tRNA(Asn)/glutamyl-tRNA(Gln) amidotransferase subunit C
MKIDKKLILRLERLAMLELSEGEREQLQGEMNDMLGMISKLESLDTTNVEPLIHLSKRSDVMRADEVKNQVTVEAALKNAPNHNGQYFKVPKVIK